VDFRTKTPCNFKLSAGQHASMVNLTYWISPSVRRSRRYKKHKESCKTRHRRKMPCPTCIKIFLFVAYFSLLALIFTVNLLLQQSQIKKRLSLFVLPFSHHCLTPLRKSRTALPSLICTFLNRKTCPKLTSLPGSGGTSKVTIMSTVSL